MTAEGKKDTGAIIIIGAAVGLLVQPILANNLPGHTLTLALRLGVFFGFLVLAPLALWILSLVDRAWHGIYQFGQFGAVGVLNSFIDVGVLNLETFLYGSSVVGAGLFAAFKAISFLFATTNSFLWNRSWTFSAHRKDDAKEVASFYIVAGLGWIINVGVATAVKVLGPGSSDAHAALWTNIIAPLAGIAASFLWNFIGYKYVVFKK